MRGGERGAEGQWSESTEENSPHSERCWRRFIVMREASELMDKLIAVAMFLAPGFSSAVITPVQCRLTLFRVPRPARSSARAGVHIGSEQFSAPTQFDFP